MTEIDFSAYENQLVELYSGELDIHEDEFFSLGYIIKELDNYLLFMSISEAGTLESIQIRSKKFVTKIMTNTEYTKMYEVFIDCTKENGGFDCFSLETQLDLGENTSVDKILSDSLMLKRTLSIVTSEDENILTGKLVLLDVHKIAISVLDYERVGMVKKRSLSLANIISIDIVSLDNFLYSQYLRSKNI